MTDEEKRLTMCLALGRLFRIGSRAYEPGDDDEYMRIRSLILDLQDPLRLPELPDLF